MGLTRRALERVPDGQFEFKPHPTSVTLGRLAEHLTEMPQWATITMTQSWHRDDHPTAARLRTAGHARAKCSRSSTVTSRTARANVAGKTDGEFARRGR